MTCTQTYIGIHEKTSIQIFKKKLLKKKKTTTTYTPNNRINFLIVYELDTQSQDLDSDFTLKDSLFGGFKLAKNADPNKYIYTGYGIGFNSHSEFSLHDGSMGKKVITSGVDMSSSVHIDNKKKDILILGFHPTQGFHDTTLTAEAQLIFQDQIENFV